MKLITLGCSWTEGLGDEEQLGGWAGRLAKELDVDQYINLGGAGDANIQQYAELCKQDIDKDTVVIFGLSGFGRRLTQFDSNWTVKYPGQDDEEYYRVHHNEGEVCLQTVNLIELFQQRCDSYGAQHLTFMSFDKVEYINGNYDLTTYHHMYNNLNTDCIIQDTNMSDYIANGHSNEYSQDTMFSRMANNLWKIDFVNLKFKTHPSFAPDGHPSAHGYSTWTNYLLQQTSQRGYKFN